MYKIYNTMNNETLKETLIELLHEDKEFKYEIRKALDIDDLEFEIEQINRKIK